MTLSFTPSGVWIVQLTVFSIIMTPLPGLEKNPELDDIIIKMPCKKTEQNPGRDDIITEKAKKQIRIPEGMTLSFHPFRGLDCSTNRFFYNNDTPSGVRKKSRTG